MPGVTIEFSRLTDTTFQLETTTIHSASLTFCCLSWQLTPDFHSTVAYGYSLEIELKGLA